MRECGGSILTRILTGPEKRIKETGMETYVGYSDHIFVMYKFLPLI
jgi:hypothetical protein